MRRTRVRGLAAVALSAALAAMLGACSSASTETSPVSGFAPGVIDKTYSGTTITVLVPPWATYNSSILEDFTGRTGIKVKVETVDFDAIHDKIVTASASGQAPADVIELDWTWVSQFGAAGWLTPLDKYLTKGQLQDAVGASAFNYKNQTIGLAYNLDFRGTILNMSKFEKAGISDPPATWAELLQDAKAIKKAGVVKYPIGIPLSITENTSTPWYTLVRAAGGDVLDAEGQPAFVNNGVGESSLQFIRDAYQAGVIDPGAIGLSTEQVGQAFVGGNSALLLSASPGTVNSSRSNVSGSNIVGDKLLFVHAPGRENNTGATISLEEALAIPVASSHKEAAAMYLSWQAETKQQLAAFNDPKMGLLPTSQAALKELESSKDNAELIRSVLPLIPSIEPVIPGGPPTWYTKFSAEAAATIQSVALGHVTAAAAVDSLAQKTKQFAAKGR